MISAGNNVLGPKGIPVGVIPAHGASSTTDNPADATAEVRAAIRRHHLRDSGKSDAAGCEDHPPEFLGVIVGESHYMAYKVAPSPLAQKLPQPDLPDSAASRTDVRAQWSSRTSISTDLARSVSLLKNSATDESRPKKISINALTGLSSSLIPDFGPLLFAPDLAVPYFMGKVAGVIFGAAIEGYRVNRGNTNTKYRKVLEEMVGEPVLSVVSAFVLHGLFMPKENLQGLIASTVGVSLGMAGAKAVVRGVGSGEKAVKSLGERISQPSFLYGASSYILGSAVGAGFLFNLSELSIAGAIGLVYCARRIYLTVHPKR